MTRASTNSPPKGKAAACAPCVRGRPRDEGLHARRCEQILDKATAVFARHGYPNTDVQFIADPLSISKGTVYRYFPSKERLFLAAVERGVRDLDVHIQSAIEWVADPVDRMVAATRAYLEYFEDHPDLVELFIQERAEFGGRKKPIYFEHEGSACAEWTGVIEGLIAAGRLRPIPVERVKETIGDLLYGTMFTNHMVGRRRPFDEQASSIMDVFFNGVLSDAERARRVQNGVGPRAVPATVTPVPAASPPPSRVPAAVSRPRAGRPVLKKSRAAGR